MINAPSFPWIRAGAPALVLAPMEGVTDVAMRALLSELGGFTYCVAEFFRVSKAAPRPRSLQRHVPELLNGGKTPTGTPVQVQLLGGNPDKLAEAAVVAVRAGTRAVDLNFGCPARTVNRHDGGATLLQYPDRIREIVAAVRAAVPAEIPVSAKLRLGWDSIDSIHVNATRAEDGGANWITIHARTKTQGYRPPAYWKPLKALRERLSIPIVANGEIWSVDDLRRCQDETGCEHFMLGRGALAAPALGNNAAHALGVPACRGPQSSTRSPAEWAALFHRYKELCMAMGFPPFYVLARTKQWLRMGNHDGRLPLFDLLKRCDDFGELMNALARHIAEPPLSRAV